jgi:hypothetical protein
MTRTGSRGLSAAKAIHLPRLRVTWPRPWANVVSVAELTTLGLLGVAQNAGRAERPVRHLAGLASRWPLDGPNALPCDGVSAVEDGGAPGLARAAARVARGGADSKVSSWREWQRGYAILKSADRRIEGAGILAALRDAEE